MSGGGPVGDIPLERAVVSSEDAMLQESRDKQSELFAALDMVCEKYNRVVLVSSKRDLMLDGTYRTYIVSSLLWAVLLTYVYTLGYARVVPVRRSTIALVLLCVCMAVIGYNMAFAALDTPLHLWFFSSFTEWSAAVCAVCYLVGVTCGQCPDDCMGVENPVSTRFLLPVMTILAANVYVPAISVTIAVVICMTLTIELDVVLKLRARRLGMANRLVSVLFMLSILLAILQSYLNR